MTAKLSNTDRLIKDLEYSIKAGRTGLNFLVGKYTGNGLSVVAALRRRGFKVTKVPAGGVACYRLEAGSAA